MSEAEYGRAVLELVDTALETLGSTGDDTLAFRCGPTTVRIRSHIVQPRQDFRPFSHLPSVHGRDAAMDAAPELLVHVCDGPFPAPDGRQPPSGFHRARDGRHFVAVTDGPPMVVGLRSSENLAVSWIDDVAHEPPYTSFRPLAEIFSAWFPTQGLVLLHAAAVGDADGVVLLVGDGGSGKSTTAVLCSQAGLGFLADDFCLLEPGASPRVHSIYRSAKLRPDSAHRLPGVGASARDSSCDDHFFLVDEEATIVHAAVRAIVAVRPSTDPTGAPRLERATQDESFPLLLPTALKVPTGGTHAYRQWLQAAHTITRRLPAFVLELTWDTERVVELVRHVLDAEQSRDGNVVITTTPVVAVVYHRPQRAAELLEVVARRGPHVPVALDRLHVRSCPCATRPNTCTTRCGVSSHSSTHSTRWSSSTVGRPMAR